MEIGNRIKNLRIQKNLTQEELAERTNLSKGYISQVERDLSMPSMEVFFDLLEVLGSSPKEFFDEQQEAQKVVYNTTDSTRFEAVDGQYAIQWLVPESNENEMEPIKLTLEKKGHFKEFSPSMAETFAYVIKGSICIEIGKKRYYAQQGDAVYYHANDTHQIFNQADGESSLLVVVTDSYL